MSGTESTLTGPDLAKGVPVSQIADGLAIENGEVVLLARCGEDLFAIGATCTHYGAPLAEGLLVGDTVLSPWHHACFSLHTGAALRAPALDGVPRWRVERRDGKAYVKEKVESAARPAGPRFPVSRRIRIVRRGFHLLRPPPTRRPACRGSATKGPWRWPSGTVVKALMSRAQDAP